MSPTPAPYSLRPANKSDRELIKRFIQGPAYTHRHLDWRDPLDWLGRQAFWLLEKNSTIEAVLVCVAEPEEVAWVRLFSAGSHVPPAWAWNALFERVRSWIDEQPARPILATLGLQDWFIDLVAANHFIKYQDIIVLSYDGPPPPTPPPAPGLLVRAMRREDIVDVTRIDNCAFEPVWRLSRDDLERAFDRCTYKTVAELDGVIVGYQMSSVNGFTAHLARLAVDPQCQRRRIGYRVLQDVLEHFLKRLDVWGVTLNTQDNNQASLALYLQSGFHLTGERFPVYFYPYRDKA